ncbi:NADH-cytochrome b5 reductase 2 [Leucoagaricus sp. SymC.cos]|nr:NADH-cytochrome b5 reductase 2 [Leucoagaricus sp. SymC.cos]
MSLLRTALASSPRVIGRRFASTAPEKKSSNLPAILIATGVGAAGLYYYLEAGKPASKAKPTRSSLDPENYKDFKLKKIKPYNHNTSEFVFELPKDEASLLPVTSFVYIKASDSKPFLNGNGKPVVRPYTPISAPDQLGEITFLIKKYETGNMSKYIHELKEGETIAIKGPLGKFPYKENEFGQVALIGGGSGITPLYQLLTHALESPNNKTKFTLLYSNVTEKDILLREELEALKKKSNGKLDIVYFLDKPSDNWKGSSGFIDANAIKKYVGPPNLKEKIKVFVCGPPPQITSIAGKKDGPQQGEFGGILKELGYTVDQVFKF